MFRLSPSRDRTPTSPLTGTRPEAGNSRSPGYTRPQHHPPGVWNTMTSAGADPSTVAGRGARVYAGGQHGASVQSPQRATAPPSPPRATSTNRIDETGTNQLHPSAYVIRGTLRSPSVDVWLPDTPGSPGSTVQCRPQLTEARPPTADPYSRRPPVEARPSAAHGRPAMPLNRSSPPENHGETKSAWEQLMRGLQSHTQVPVEQEPTTGRRGRSQSPSFRRSAMPGFNQLGSPEPPTGALNRSQSQTNRHPSTGGNARSSTKTSSMPESLAEPRVTGGTTDRGQEVASSHQIDSSTELSFSRDLYNQGYPIPVEPSESRAAVREDSMSSFEFVIPHRDTKDTKDSLVNTWGGLHMERSRSAGEEELSRMAVQGLKIERRHTSQEVHFKVGEEKEAKAENVSVSVPQHSLWGNRLPPHGVATGARAGTGAGTGTGTGTGTAPLLGFRSRGLQEPSQQALWKAQQEATSARVVAAWARLAFGSSIQEKERTKAKLHVAEIKAREADERAGQLQLSVDLLELESRKRRKESMARVKAAEERENKTRKSLELLEIESKEERKLMDELTDRLKVQLRKSTTEKQSLEGKVAEMQKQLEEARKQLAAAEARVSEEAKKAGQLQAKMLEMETKRKGLEEKLKKAQDDARSLLVSRAVSTKTCNDLQCKMGRMEEENRALREEVQCLKAQASAAPRGTNAGDANNNNILGQGLRQLQRSESAGTGSCLQGTHSLLGLEVNAGRPLQEELMGHLAGAKALLRDKDQVLTLLEKRERQAMKARSDLEAKLRRSEDRVCALERELEESKDGRSESESGSSPCISDTSSDDSDVARSAQARPSAVSFLERTRKLDAEVSSLMEILKNRRGE